MANLDALMHKIRLLSVEDRKKLIGLILDTFTESNQPGEKPDILDSQTRDTSPGSVVQE